MVTRRRCSEIDSTSEEESKQRRIERLGEDVGGSIRRLEGRREEECETNDRRRQSGIWSEVSSSFSLSPSAHFFILLFD